MKGLNNNNTSIIYWNERLRLNYYCILKAFKTFIVRRILQIKVVNYVLKKITIKDIVRYKTNYTRTLNISTLTVFPFKI